MVMIRLPDSESDETISSRRLEDADVDKPPRDPPPPPPRDNDVSYSGATPVDPTISSRNGVAKDEPSGIVKSK